jgi:hypothetical protein
MTPTRPATPSAGYEVRATADATVEDGAPGPLGVVSLGGVDGTAGRITAWTDAYGESGHVHTTRHTPLSHSQSYQRVGLPACSRRRSCPLRRAGSPDRDSSLTAPFGRSPRLRGPRDLASYGLRRWRSRGKMTASRMLSSPSIVITSRSPPSPQPAWGGIP